MMLHVPVSPCCRLHPTTSGSPGFRDCSSVVSGVFLCVLWHRSQVLSWHMAGNGNCFTAALQSSQQRCRPISGWRELRMWETEHLWISEVWLVWGCWAFCGRRQRRPWSQLTGILPACTHTCLGKEPEAEIWACSERSEFRRRQQPVQRRRVGKYSWSAPKLGFLVVVQYGSSICCSVAQSCLTLCNPMDCLSFTIFRNLLKLTSFELVMPSNHLSSVAPFSSCPQSFPTSGSFPMSWLFISGGQSSIASASVLSMNIQDWFPLGLTGLISMQTKGLSRVFSNTIVQKHQFFGTYPPKKSARLWLGLYWIYKSVLGMAC